MNKIFTLTLLINFFSIFFSDSLKTNYWLVIGTYRQGPFGRPEESVITCPSLHSVPMKHFDNCKNSGEKIS